MSKEQHAQNWEGMLSCAQPQKVRCALVTPPASSYQFQTDPESDGYEETRGGSKLTGTGIRAEGTVSNVGLCNEMRTVSEHDGWRTRNVRAMRLLELWFLPKRERRRSKISIQAAGVGVASS